MTEISIQLYSIPLIYSPATRPARALEFIL